YVVPLPEGEAERAARDDDRGDGAHPYPQRLAHQRGQAEEDDGAADHDDGRQNGQPADGRHGDGVRSGVRRRMRRGEQGCDHLVPSTPLTATGGWEWPVEGSTCAMSWLTDGLMRSSTGLG